MHENLPPITLRPRNLLERWRFFLRRPDYGWRGFVRATALEIRPTNGEIGHRKGESPTFLLEEQVKGMKTKLWIPEGAFDPAPFRVKELPDASAWELEWREVVMDYIRHLWPNSPSILMSIVLILVMGGVLLWMQKDPGPALAYIMEGNVTKLAVTILLICVVPVLGSLVVCERRPSRTRLANLFFQLEALLILFWLATSAPDLKGGIEHFRTQANQMSQQLGGQF